jgi:lysophospholipase L1-like esterase
MATRARTLVISGVVALLALVVAGPAVAARPALNPGQPVQLSLGDSWGSGYGAAPGAGYVDVLHERLQADWACLPARSDRARGGCPSLQLENISVPGATTPTLIAGQLPAATALLADRNGDANPRNDVEVVTVSIGGNDVVNPILEACLGGVTVSCQQTVQAEFAAYAADLRTALSALRTAAGPDTPIVLGTYDNGLGACVLAPAEPLGDLVLEGGGPLPAGLHDIMRGVAAEYGVLIADSYGDLQVPEDWVGGQDCLHPDASGYAVVAHAFAEALGL